MFENAWEEAAFKAWLECREVWSLKYKVPYDNDQSRSS